MIDASGVCPATMISSASELFTCSSCGVGNILMKGFVDALELFAF